MTKREAKKQLQTACELILQVEQQMDVKTSNVRRQGFNARMAVGHFMDAITLNKEEDLTKL